MSGICPVCQQPLLPGASACTRPDCLRRSVLFERGTIAPTPAPPDLFGQSTQANLAAPAALVTSELSIPGYQVLREIGRGGMGLVVEGRQLSLDRRVAIKLLPPHLATNRDFVQRFQREANTLARLSHAHIVTVIDRGQQGELFYFVMEYVQPPGGDRPSDLRQLIRGGQLDVRNTHRLILQIVRALGYAHQQGVIHRDIKPSNILLDQHHNARITDFGIAACIGDRNSDQQLTATGVGMGTSDYMAPEQRFDASGTDHRADIYSTGIVLYEMLTGQRPTFDYLPPSKARPGISPGWDAIVARALKTVPQERFPDMMAFAAAVESVDTVGGIAPPLPVAEETFTAMTANVQLTPAPTGTSPSVVCLDCSGPIRPIDAYCPKCGLNTTPECPACGVRSQAGQRYCAACRTDLQRAPRFDGYRQQGNQLLMAAERDGEASDRAGKAEKALGAFQAALQLYPDHRGLVDSLSRSRSLLLKLLLQAGDQAQQQNNPPQARALYQRVLSEQPDHPQALARLQDLDKKRNGEVAEAAQLLNQGQFAAALQLLERVQKRYPNDSQLDALIRSTRQHQTLMKNLLTDVAPRLEQERRYVELLNVLVDLQRRNLEVPNALLDRCRKKLAPLKETLQAATAAVKDEDPVQATALAKEALQSVADHPLAMQILGLGADGRQDPARRTNPLRIIGRILREMAILAGILTVFVGVGGIGCFVYLEQHRVGLSEPSGPPPSWFWNHPAEARFSWTVPTNHTTAEPFKVEIEMGKQIEGTRYHALPESAEKADISFHAYQGKFTPSVPSANRVELAGDKKTILPILGARSATVTERVVDTCPWAKKEFIYRSPDGRSYRLRYYLDRYEGIAYYFWVSSHDSARLDAPDTKRYFDSLQLP